MFNEVLYFLLTGFAILGGIRSLIYFYSFVRKRRGEFSWKDIEKGSKDLIKKIKTSGYNPEVIIGIGRGGSIIAAIVSGNLGIISLTAIDRKYIRSDSGHRETEIIDFGNLGKIKDKKILLIIASIYTGETILKAREYVLSKNPKELKTASIFLSEVSSFIPNYYVYEVKEVMREPWRLLPEYRKDSKSPF